MWGPILRLLSLPSLFSQEVGLEAPTNWLPSAPWTREDSGRAWGALFTWSRRYIWEDVLSSINMTGEFPGHQGIPITLTHIGQDPGSKRFKEERCLKSEIVGWRTGSKPGSIYCPWSLLSWLCPETVLSTGLHRPGEDREC